MLLCYFTCARLFLPVKAHCRAEIAGVLGRKCQPVVGAFSCAQGSPTFVLGKAIGQEGFFCLFVEELSWGCL